ncbi:MFS transporter [Streptomyces sp. NPDC047017]|uniref:MFS transporter n=1 Tax=Streptomyces sp. NPDC047017 TaxID=3155024 RepID=UPI0033D55C05
MTSDNPVPTPLPGTSRPAHRAALAVLLTGVFLAVLDTFIVLVAAPALQRDLRADDADLQLVLAGYQLTYAVALITGARLGDLFGRRRCFVAGLLLFTLASAACAAAPGPGALIGARLVQGLGAAVLFPQVFSTLQVLVPAERRPRVFGLLGAVIGAAGVTGQLLGGLLLSADLFGQSWRPVFWVNVPVGLLTAVLAVRYVPESRTPAGRRPDLAGAAVLTAALALVVVPLVEGREAGWPWWTWAALAAGAALLAAFAVVERRVAAAGGTPLVSPGLLRERAFATGMVLVLLAYCGINSFFLVLSVTVQDGLGLDALGAGLCYLPFAVAFFAGSLAAGRLARHGRLLLTAGALILAAGHAGCLAVVATEGGSLTAGALAAPLAVIGLGNGALVTPLLHTVLARVRPAEAGMASGVLSTGQQVGGAVGVAVLGVVFYGLLGSARPGDVRAYGRALGGCLALDVLLALALAVLPLLLPRTAPAGGPEGAGREEREHAGRA